MLLDVAVTEVQIGISNCLLLLQIEYILSIVEERSLCFMLQNRKKVCGCSHVIEHNNVVVAKKLCVEKIRQNI